MIKASLASSLVLSHISKLKLFIMNKWTLIIVFSLMTHLVSAQRFAYVNVNYIMDNIPEYIEAQEKLDEISKGWQSEVEAK